MAGSLLLGVDVGTFSSKAVLCSPEGDVLATETIEHDLSIPRPGWAEQDADAVWWHDCAALIRRLTSGRFTGEDVAAVAVSAIGPCLLPVDAQGRALRPGILYGIDTRATVEIEELTSLIGEDALLESGGMVLTSQSIAPKIRWLRKNEPDIDARATGLMTSTSYLVLKLTGEAVIDHHTASYFNPLYDRHRQGWSDRWADDVCDPERLPRILWPDEIAGMVTAAAARETGLRAGTPVTTGTIDAAAEAVSVGVADVGDMMVMYGTTMFFIQVAAQPIPDRRMWSTAYLFEGLHDIAGGMSTTGALTRWFRDTFAADLVDAERAGGPNAYEVLAAEAAQTAPGADGVICLPYWSGERTPINDPEARGVLAGLTLAHTRGHCYRAVLEGAGFGVRHNLEVMSGMGATPRRLVAVGGGAQNPVWMQIVSDVCEVPQVLPNQTIGACYGDAFLAGLASGVLPNRAALSDWVTVREVIEPRAEHAALYGELYALYRELQTQTEGVLHALSRLS
ncbi:MAG: FGGY-family carbohydrate kinase [Thermomicrobiales bacterium]|nr:FGGY-family carbohydrate kinase [Thermomicrobiales bacterium]